MMKVPIVITGFMGSGKTTVAQALAQMLGWSAVDLDHLITERTGRTPQEIIDEDGEPSFRKLETQLLREVLENGAAGVIALGGGAWTSETNRDLIAGYNCFVAWLDAPFALCWQRIATGQHRPLARSQEQARKLYEERRPLYELSTLRVAVADKGIDEATTDIVRHLSTLEIADRP
jgi:shikimate kinase